MLLSGTVPRAMAKAPFSGAGQFRQQQFTLLFWGGSASTGQNSVFWDRSASTGQNAVSGTVPRATARICSLGGSASTGPKFHFPGTVPRAKSKRKNLLAEPSSGRFASPGPKIRFLGRFREHWRKIRFLGRSASTGQNSFLWDGSASSKLRFLFWDGSASTDQTSFLWGGSAGSSLNFFFGRFREHKVPFCWDGSAGKKQKKKLTGRTLVRPFLRTLDPI